MLFYFVPVVKIILVISLCLFVQSLEINVSEPARLDLILSIEHYQSKVFFFKFFYHFSIYLINFGCGGVLIIIVTSQQGCPVVDSCGLPFLPIPPLTLVSSHSPQACRLDKDAALNRP